MFSFIVIALAHVFLATQYAFQVTRSCLFDSSSSRFAQFVPAPTDLITKIGYAGVQVRYKEVPVGICHEVPFYQPLAALTIFERAINGKDIATGNVDVSERNYYTVGPPQSTYREGNSTIQLEVVPVSATYNTTTGAPNPYSSTDGNKKRSLLAGVKRAKPIHKKRKGRKV